MRSTANTVLWLRPPCWRVGQGEIAKRYQPLSLGRDVHLDALYSVACLCTRKRSSWVRDMGRFADLLGERFVGKGLSWMKWLFLFVVKVVLRGVPILWVRMWRIYVVMAKFRGPDSRALHAAVSWTPGGWQVVYDTVTHLSLSLWWVTWEDIAGAVDLSNSM